MVAVGGVFGNSKSLFFWEKKKVVEKENLGIVILLSHYYLPL
jgi:hypothetical protein